MDSLKIGIAGVGTVGTCVVVKLLDGSVKDTTITRLAARDINKDRGLKMPESQWTQNALDLADADDVDVVVELIGGADGTALDLVRAALANKKHIVTANKALLSKHGVELAELAEKNNCILKYEAAVAGGIPVIKALSEGLAANNIFRINGILNGTCNFILTEMETKGAGYEETLSIAQELGYAEADPTFDVEGIDAAQKLSLLSAIAFGQKPNENDVLTRGISDVAAIDFEFAKGFEAVIRLIARAEKKINKSESSSASISGTSGEVVQVVEPCLVRKTSVLSGISGVTNAVQFETDMVDVMLQGPGAGGEATASAVLADIADLSQFMKSGMRVTPHVFGRSVSELVASQSETEVMPSQWYIRLNLKDAPGSMAKVTSILAEHDVSIEEAVQRGPQNSEDHRPVVFITHKCEKSAIKNALAALEAIDVIAKDVNYMPVI